MSPRNATPRERFEAQYNVQANGCWLWLGRVNSYGYGCYKFNGRLLYAHRVSYEYHVGNIAAGLQIDHLCRNRRCVNPGHLEAVTIRENVLRGDGYSAKNARKTRCKRGHEFDHVSPDGRRRYCQTCHRWMRQLRLGRPLDPDAHDLVSDRRAS